MRNGQEQIRQLQTGEDQSVLLRQELARLPRDEFLCGPQTLATHSKR